MKIKITGIKRNAVAVAMAAAAVSLSACTNLNLGAENQSATQKTQSLGATTFPLNEETVVIGDGHVIASSMTTLERQARIDRYRAEVTQHLRSKIAANYAPRTEYQMYLPLDIADIPVLHVKEGYLTNADLKGRKDKLSIYLSQNKQAQHFFGLYKQRILAFHGGTAPLGMTIEEGMNEEAVFDFLSIQLDAFRVTELQLAYFANRLSAGDYTILAAWVADNSQFEQRSKKATVLEVLTEYAVISKLGSTEGLQ